MIMKTLCMLWLIVKKKEYNYFAFEAPLLNSKLLVFAQWLASLYAVYLNVLVVLFSVRFCSSAPILRRGPHKQVWAHVVEEQAKQQK